MTGCEIWKRAFKKETFLFSRHFCSYFNLSFILKGSQRNLSVSRLIPVSSHYSRIIESRNDFIIKELKVDSILSGFLASIHSHLIYFLFLFLSLSLFPSSLLNRKFSAWKNQPEINLTLVDFFLSYTCRRITDKTGLWIEFQSISVECAINTWSSCHVENLVLKAIMHVGWEFSFLFL